MFKVFIETFADDFGIVYPEELETQRREIVPEFVQLDAVAVFPDDFDYTTLKDQTFPFLGKYDGFEYKSLRDALTVMRCYQYSFTELGILTTYFLSKLRKDRKERQSLSQVGAREQWQRLRAQGAMHSCCVVILSTGDPKLLRKEVGFEAVSDYPHLDGALYRQVMSENQFVGSIATYLVVLNHLPTHPKNASLLLLAKGRKQAEYCRWLLEEDTGMTLQRKQHLIYYLFKYNLIEDQEVETEMKRNIFLQGDDYEWFLDIFDEGTEEHKARFLKKAHKKMLGADTPLEVAQKVLQADSPVELALQAIQSEQELNEFLSRIQLRNQKTVSTSTQQAAASA